jgi:hypothetical protein
VVVVAAGDAAGAVGVAARLVVVSDFAQPIINTVEIATNSRREYFDLLVFMTQVDLWAIGKR